ncbi:transposase family protein [Sphingobium cupriresistens]|uniref:Transposase family protein n=1 Tax=Sphingobium cupriresistens TaxID=1132417 RepID=A0A8G1ZHP1_9SPHN|nr:transposase family protein [Sphingobium cupriresistens]RYM10899.1 transposase family protein [Sphingobium cupriresistens]
MQQSSNSNGVHLEEEMILQMQRLATGRTDEALNARFGISYNTWRKLLAGQPIRPSLANRLKGRIAALQAINRP